KRGDALRRLRVREGRERCVRDAAPRRGGTECQQHDDGSRGAKDHERAPARAAIARTRAARRSQEYRRTTTRRARRARRTPRSGAVRSSSTCFTILPTFPGGWRSACSRCTSSSAICPLALATIGTLAAAYSRTLSGEK